MKDSDLPLEPPGPRCPRCAAALGPAGLCASPRCLLREALDEEPLPDSLPASFGDYQFLAKLGEGGMGVVYKVRQVSVERVVALKRIRDGELAGAAARRRFLSEATAAAKLHHPHIVRMYEVGQHDGQPYFTMQHLSGGTLAGAAGRYSEPRRAAALVATLARAVHEGHRCRIVHRDLKPENILFDEQLCPYVADFGVAKHLDRDNGSTLSAVVGTVEYMAPEQASGQATRDTAAADVWSLGVILYELLGGQRPFLGHTPLEVLRRALEEEPEPLEVLRREVGRDLATVCLTCLRKDPAGRYISAAALADDLERYLRDEPVLARRPGRLTRAARWCGRHPASAALFGFATMAVIALTLWAFTSARAQERARRDEVLATNTYAARAVAGTVLAKLEEYADRVSAEARDPGLAAALASGDEAELMRLCAVIQGRESAEGGARTAGDESAPSGAKRPAGARREGSTEPIGWWFIVDTGGALRAQVPVPTVQGSHARDYAFRDYFRGGMALPAGVDRAVYVSRGFRSTGDLRYKLALAAPIRGDDGSLRGLLVGEIATSRRLGALDMSDERRSAVLTVRHDREAAGEPLPDEHILLMHDGVEHGEGVVVESAALRRLTALRDAAGTAPHQQLRLPPHAWVQWEDDYRDPLAERDPAGAGGPWLAGVAPVGYTELAVIVQTRVGDATALDRMPLRVLAVWSLGGGALLFAGLFVALRTGRRRRAASEP